MKRYAYFLFAILIFIGHACTKQDIVTKPATVIATFKDSALAYLRVTLPAKDFAALNSASIKPLQDGQGYRGAVIYFKDFQARRFMLLHQTANSFTGSKVDLTQLQANVQHNYSGLINTEALDGEQLTVLTIKNNTVSTAFTFDKFGNKLSVVNDNNTLPPSKSTGAGASPVPMLKEIVLPDVVVTAYVHDNTTEFWSMYWLLNSSSSLLGFYSSGIDVNSSSGGGGSGGSGGYQSGNNNVASSPQFTSPDNPIENVAEELKCFTVNPTSKYNITVNINQPNPNSRLNINPASDFVAGHAFLTLEQINTDGSRVVRNVGFYPKNGAKAGVIADASIYGEDSQTPFNVSLKMSVTGAELQTISGSLQSYQSKFYNMNSFNCTNAVIGALQSIHVALPQTRSMGVLFNGISPADFGQDIKEMNLNNFKAENPGRVIDRNTSTSNNLKSPAKAGRC